MDTDLYVPADIAEALGSLARVTTGQDEVLERLGQALMIAQMGGVTNEVLGVLLHLAVARTMTPTVAQRLRDVGIDPCPMDAAPAGATVTREAAREALVNAAEDPYWRKTGFDTPDQHRPE